jgi:hypothetical protein
MYSFFAFRLSFLFSQDQDQQYHIIAHKQAKFAIE